MPEGPRSIVRGGKRMADVRHLFTDHARRLRSPDRISGIAAHHDGVVFEPGDRDYSGSTLDEDLARLWAIYRHALQKGWRRFPYHFAATPNGRTFYTLSLTSIGAHVRDRNSVLAGVVLLGNFEDEPPGDRQLCAAGVAIAATWRELGRLVTIRPHWGWALREHPTICPGGSYPLWGGSLLSMTAYHATNELVS